MMRWGEKLRLRIRMLFHRGQEVQRLDDEIHFHLEQQMAENISAGMNPTEARRTALRVFGNPLLIHEESREAWSWNRLELIAHDVRIGIRTLVRKPRLALIAILVIAIGIGANVALFTDRKSVV